MKDLVLLLEDDDGLRNKYEKSLRSYNFDVIPLEDGSLIYKILHLSKIKGIEPQAIVSDTEMEHMDGPEAVRAAVEAGILDDKRTLIIGMSGDSANQEYWRGLAHLNAFYDKTSFIPEKLGEIVEQCLKNFRRGGLWREKMPKINW